MRKDLDKPWTYTTVKPTTGIGAGRKLRMDCSIAKIENIDVAEAVTALHFEQIQLEASFTTIARLQTLSLSNFLR